MKMERFFRGERPRRETERVGPRAGTSGLRDGGAGVAASEAVVVFLLGAHEAADAALLADAVGDIARVHPHRHLDRQIPAQKELGYASLAPHFEKDRIDFPVDRLIDDAPISAASQRVGRMPVTLEPLE